jgi:hypothetical protein
MIPICDALWPVGVVFGRHAASKPFSTTLLQILGVDLSRAIVE